MVIVSFERDETSQIVVRELPEFPGILHFAQDDNRASRCWGLEFVSPIIAGANRHLSAAIARGLPGVFQLRL
jgi:hypothetical protein